MKKELKAFALDQVIVLHVNCGSSIFLVSKSLFSLFLLYIVLVFQPFTNSLNNSVCM